MTEAEWLVSEEYWVMLEHLGKTTGRKERLVLVACCRAHAGRTANPSLPLALAAAERYADGFLAVSTLRRYRQKVGRVNRNGTGYETAALPVDERHATNLCILAATSAGSAGWQPIPEVLHPGILMGDFSPELSRSLPAILRDIFGNPFRPVTADPAWLTSDVVALATGIYADRAFDRMPILADALQDSGCDNEDVLSHCRSDGPHCRGCFVVDLLLGKE